VYVFAECDGIEAKRTFQFAETGRHEIEIIKDKPAQISCSTPKRLDSSAKTYEGLRMAKDKGITFEQVTLLIGSSPKVIHLSLGEMSIQAEFLEEALMHLQKVVPPDAPVILSFKKAYTHTGYDLEQFTKALGIELKNGEVIQE
jgi:hypothetical protein